MSRVRMIVSELVGLACDSLGNLGTAIADIDAIQAGETIEVAAPFRVRYSYPLATFDYGGIAALTGRIIFELRERMQNGSAIARADRGMLVILFPSGG